MGGCTVEVPAIKGVRGGFELRQFVVCVADFGTEISWIGSMHNMQQFVVRQSVFALNFGIIES